jgi:hypothetical protein
MKRTLGALVAAAGLAVASLPFLVNSPATPAGAQASLAPRAHTVMLARDGVFSSTPSLPPPDPSYCPATGNPPAPPNSIIGTLTIGGAPAPAGTVVQIVLDGKNGPARLTSQAGGYRVDYAVGGPGCPNHVGAPIGIRVNGQLFSTPLTAVAGGSGVPARHDLVVP